jgi:hypothetical protein
MATARTDRRNRCLVTATCARAVRYADLEMAAPVVTNPNMTQSSKQLIPKCGWKRGQNRRGRIWIEAVSLHSERKAVVAKEPLRAGGSEHNAKQKAFVTVLAMAPSPAFYWAEKKSLSQLGDFFSALVNGRVERSGRAGLYQEYLLGDQPVS